MDQHHPIFRAWDLYDRIGAGNYMRHREIADALRGALRARPGPLRVLDLGCGDGGMSRRVFAESDVVRFVGVDTSAAALERFARGPAPGARPEAVHRDLVHATLAEALRAQPASGVDVVHAGYVLHHYPAAEKPPLLDEIARVLAPGGWLLWTDLVRDEGEDRDAYLARSAASIRASWDALSPGEREETVDHMRDSDFPEPASWMAEQLARRGVPLAGTPYRDPFYAALCFAKTG
jgi:SAM-dependent methyltransferase